MLSLPALLLPRLYARDWDRVKARWSYILYSTLLCNYFAQYTHDNHNSGLLNTGNNRKAERMKTWPAWSWRIVMQFRPFYSRPRSVLALFNSNKKINKMSILLCVNIWAPGFILFPHDRAVPSIKALRKSLVAGTVPTVLSYSAHAVNAWQYTLWFPGTVTVHISHAYYLHWFHHS